MWLDALQNTPPVNELTSGRLAIETICLYCLVAFVQGTGVGEFNHRLFNLCSFMLLSLYAVTYITYLSALAIIPAYPSLRGWGYHANHG